MQLATCYRRRRDVVGNQPLIHIQAGAFALYENANRLIPEIEVKAP